MNRKGILNTLEDLSILSFTSFLLFSEFFVNTEN